MDLLTNRFNRLSDFLPTHRFYVLDVSFTIPTVFNISYGFSHCSAPEITVDTKQVKEGNYEFHRFIPVGANVSPISLQQGVRIFNSDFYDWVISCIEAKKTFRRNLLLIQFTDVAAIGGNGSGSIDSLIGSFLPLGDILARIPGRAWMLRDCIPVSYKAGTDMDALSAQVSIAELSIQPTEVEEFSLGI